MSCLFDFLLKPWIYDDTKGVECIPIAPRSGDQWSLVGVSQREKVSGQYMKQLNNSECHHYNFLMNERTKQLYLIERTGSISYRSLRAIDCAIIALVNPLHFGGTIVWNFTKIFFDIPIVAFNALSHLIRDFQSHSISIALRNFFKECRIEFYDKISKDIVNIARAPFYALGIEIAACEGVLFDSFKGMANVALIERAWNHNLSYHYHIGAFDNYPGLEGTRTFFLSYNFQPRGNYEWDTVDNGQKKWQILEKVTGNLVFPKDKRRHIPILPLFSFITDFFTKQSESEYKLFDIWGREIDPIEV